MARMFRQKTAAMLRLALAGVLCAALAAPSYADRGRRAPTPPPVPELRIPPPAPLPPPVVIEAPRGPMEIVLPADFGSGGVGTDINGGYGGGRVVVYANAQANAQASASAAAFAFASASSFAGSRGGFKGGKGGCGGCR